MAFDFIYPSERDNPEYRFREIMSGYNYNFSLLEAYNEPTGLTINNLTVTGDTILNAVTASTLFIDTIYSGSSLLETYFTRRVQPGSNIITGGTGYFPIINVVDSPSFNELSTSGNTILSSTTASTLYTDYIVFNTGFTPTVIQEGKMYWDEPNQTVSIDLHAGSVSLQVGQELHYLVKNQSGATIQNGRAVRAAGTLGNSGRILAEYMIADGTIPPKYTLGIATEDILDGEDGYITEFGVVRGIDTTGAPYGETWNDGDVLWVSPFTEGALTNIEPEPPAFHIEMAIVIHAHSNGSIFVRPHRYPPLHDIQQVNYSGGTENNYDILQWSNTSQAWDKTNTPTFPSISAVTFSAGTIYSGGTDLYNIFSTGSGDITRVQPGTNITTGGTDNFPVVNLADDISLNSISATTMSGGTIYSGGTDLSSIFALAGSDVTTASNGLTKTGNNITLGGSLTANTTISGAGNYINIDANVGIGGVPSTNLDVVGNMRLTGSLSAATISGAIYSAGTDLYDIFITDPGVTGSGTPNYIPMWNGSTTLTDSIMSYGSSGITVAGHVYITGNVEVLGTATTINTQDLAVKDNNILLNSGGTHTSAVGGGIFIEDGVTAGTYSTWTINSAGNWSANTSIISQGLNVESGTLLSGGTDLYNIFALAGSDTNNYVTGFTYDNANKLTVSVNDGNDYSAVIDVMTGLTVSGNLSATTIYSGATDLSDLFSTTDTNIYNSNGTITDATRTVTLNGATSSDTLVFSNGTSPLLTIRGNGQVFSYGKNFVTTNTAFGLGIFANSTVTGTYNSVFGSSSMINLTSGGLNSGFGSGVLQSITNGFSNMGMGYQSLQYLSGSSTGNVGIGATAGRLISGGGNNTYATSGIYIGTDTRASSVGRTNEIVIGASASGHGSNTVTLGTSSIVGTYLEGIIYSAGTPLETIFALAGSGDVTRVQPGTNITTGGTDNFPVVNLSDSIIITSVSATTMSGGTIYSGSTDIGTLFSTTDTNLANSNMVLTSSGGTRAIYMGGASASNVLTVQHVGGTGSIFKITGNDRISFGDSVTNNIGVSYVGQEIASISSTNVLDSEVAGYNILTDTTNFSQVIGLQMSSSVRTGALGFKLKSDTSRARGYFVGGTTLAGQQTNAMIEMSNTDKRGHWLFRTQVHLGDAERAVNTSLGEHTIIQETGTTPSTTTTGGYVQYADNITAGNVAPHFLTEGGDIVRLYQESSVTTVQGIADALTSIGLLSSSTISVASDNFYVTGFTYDGSNNFTVSVNDGNSYTAGIDTMSGVTVNGDLTVNGQSVFSGGTDVVHIYGNGDTAPTFTIEGSAGELFTVTDSLSGTLFTVNDISGLPILEVKDDDTVHIGSFVAPALHSSTKVSVNSGTTTIYSLVASGYTGAFFDYTVMHANGARSGNVMAIWSGTSNVQFSETSTTDIGDSSDLTFDVAISGTDVLFRASANTDSWTVKTIVRSI